MWVGEDGFHGRRSDAGGTVTLQAGTDVRIAGALLTVGALAVTASHDARVFAGTVIVTRAGPAVVTAITGAIWVSDTLITAEGGPVVVQAATDVTVERVAIAAIDGGIAVSAVSGTLAIGDDGLPVSLEALAGTVDLRAPVAVRLTATATAAAVATVTAGVSVSLQSSPITASASISIVAGVDATLLPPRSPPGSGARRGHRRPRPAHHRLRIGWHRARAHRDDDLALVDSPLTSAASVVLTTTASPVDAPDAAAAVSGVLLSAVPVAAATSITISSARDVRILGGAVLLAAAGAVSITGTAGSVTIGDAGATTTVTAATAVFFAAGVDLVLTDVVVRGATISASAGRDATLGLVDLGSTAGAIASSPAVMLR